MRLARLGAAFLLSLVVMPASAATLSGDILELKAPVAENLYATGGTLVVTQPVEGDVVVFAGDVLIQAPVKGDVIAAGGTVRVESRVEGDVRVASSRFLMEKGAVGGDVIYAGSQFAMGPQSSASGSVLVQAGQVILHGATGTGVHLSASDLNFGGKHAGPVQIEADALQFMGGTTVQGDITYDARTVQDVGALSAGTITKATPTELTWSDRILNTLTLAGFIGVAALILAGLLMVSSPVWCMNVTRRMSKNVAFSLFLGIFTLFAIPSLLGFMLGLQIALAPWAIVLLPLLGVLGCLYVLLILLSLGMVSLMIARLLPGSDKMSLWITVPLGALATGILMSLPAVGLFLTLLLVSLGIGGMVQTETKYLGIVPRRGKK